MEQKVYEWRGLSIIEATGFNRKDRRKNDAKLHKNRIKLQKPRATPTGENQ